MQQEKRMNVLGLVSLLIVVPTLFHGMVQSLIIFSRSDWTLMGPPTLLLSAVTTVSVVLCLASITLAIVGLLQRDRTQLRWAAIAGLSVSVAQLLMLTTNFVTGLLGNLLM